MCDYKTKTRKLEADKAKNIESDPSLLLKLEDLREQVKFLENEKLLLKEHLDHFKSNKQYSNSTRATYQDLISYAGVSANKIDKVVDIFLTQIVGIQVDRLLRFASELSGNCTNMTLHSEGTTKHGRSYTTFNLINEPSKLLV